MLLGEITLDLGSRQLKESELRWLKPMGLDQTARLQVFMKEQPLKRL